MREITKTERFEQEYTQINKARLCRRLDEHIAAAEHALARDPLLGEEASRNPPRYIRKFFDPLYKVYVVLFYTFDDDTVTFLSLRVTPRGHGG